MTYRIGFDGAITVEMERLLKSIEGRVNGLGLHAQAQTASGASTLASGSTPPCQFGQPCPTGEKGGQDLAIVIVVAAVTGAVTGYIAGKIGAKGEKGGQDNAAPK